MKTLFAAAMLAALAITPATADDLMLSGGNHGWSGMYAGVVAGYGLGTATSHEGDITGSYDFSGGLLGGTLGFNHQMGSLVLGAEGDLAWTGMKGGAPCAVKPDTFDCSGNLDWLMTLRGRAGYDAGSVLLYGTAGLAVAGVSAMVSPSPADASGRFSDTFTGWTAGLGAEFKVADDLSVKAEYDYVDLGTRTAPEGTLTTTGDSTISATTSTVRLGLNFHF